MSRVESGQGRTGTWLGGLDGLRALAVVAVVIYHFMPTALPGGFLGVDLFFVISGYLITRLLLSEIDVTGRLSVIDFYLRRIRRLLPGLLALMAIVATACSLFWRDELPTLRGGLLSGLFYVANWWLIGDHQSYFVASGRTSMLQHLWSLAIEEQFYLVWPCVLALLTGAYLWGRQRMVVITVSRLMAVAAAAVLLALTSAGLMALIAIRSDVPYGADSSRVYFGTDTHAAGLLLGAAAGALAMRARFGVPRPVLRGAFLSDAAAVIALGVLVRTALRIDEFDPALYRGGFLLVSLLCTVLVVAAPRRGGLVGWLLDRPPLPWLGQRSYSIYLWHWPVAVVTRPSVDLDASGWPVFALRVALTLALAEASYRFVEHPVRVGGLRGLAETWRLSHLSVSARIRLAPAVALGVLVVAGSLVSGLASSPRQAHAQPAPITALPTPVVASVVAPSLGPTKSAARTRSACRSAAPSRATHPAARPSASHDASRPPPVSGVSAFGDSVMLGAAPQLCATLPKTSVYAIEGRQARAVFDDIAARRAARALAPVVVIHAGDNGIISPADLDHTLGALADRRRVVLLTDRVPREWQAPNNRIMQRAVKGHPNTVLLDWYGRSNGHRDWFYDDGLHLRPAGAAAYSGLIAVAVRA